MEKLCGIEQEPVWKLRELKREKYKLKNNVNYCIVLVDVAEPAPFKEDCQWMHR